MYSTLYSLPSTRMTEPGPVETPVARINNKYLYKNDLKKLFRHNVSPQDSINIVKSYVDSWVKEQLMLSKAELNLTEEEKNHKIEKVGEELRGMMPWM